MSDERKLLLLLPFAIWGILDVLFEVVLKKHLVLNAVCPHHRTQMRDYRAGPVNLPYEECSCCGAIKLSDGTWSKS
jgi:hypothetical protein